MESMLREAQISITKQIQEIDGGAEFFEDAWVRDTGGGGFSRVLKDGNVWEKAGVNLSVVHGIMPAVALRAATEKQKTGEETVRFSATGLSCVMHPRNPHCVRILSMNALAWFEIFYHQIADDCYSHPFTANDALQL